MATPLEWTSCWHGGGGVACSPCRVSHLLLTEVVSGECSRESRCSPQQHIIWSSIARWNGDGHCCWRCSEWLGEWLSRPAKSAQRDESSTRSARRSTTHHSLTPSLRLHHGNNNSRHSDTSTDNTCRHSTIIDIVIQYWTCLFRHFMTLISNLATKKSQFCCLNEQTHFDKSSSGWISWSPSMPGPTLGEGEGKGVVLEEKSQ